MTGERGQRTVGLLLGVVTTVAAMVLVVGLALHWSPALGVPTVLRDRPVEGLAEATDEARVSARPLLIGGGAVATIGAVALVVLARRERGGRGTVWDEDGDA